MNDLISGTKKIFFKEPVTIISFVLALMTVFIVPVDKEYIGYIGYSTIGLLFTLMIIMAGLQRIGFFATIGAALLEKVKDIRLLSLVCVFLCFFFSPFITNDVALITFVPFTIHVFTMADKKKYLILVISLQTVAANLGSMLTPIGNPHNLFLYEYSKMSIQSFLALVTPYWIASIVLVVIMILIFVKKDKVDVDIELKEGEKYDSKNRAKLILYLILFTMAILVVLEVCPLIVALIITVIAALIADRKSILKVDYGLLLTFVFLFIFIGNIKRMDVVITTLDRILEGREFIVSVIASQVICDVPAAILLSAMTSNIDAIIMGTNIGAVGTLIASMASLISFKLYTNVEGGSKRKYLLWFSVINFSVLIILCIFYYIWMKMPYWIF